MTTTHTNDTTPRNPVLHGPITTTMLLDFFNDQLIRWPLANDAKAASEPTLEAARKAADKVGISIDYVDMSEDAAENLTLVYEAIYDSLREFFDSIAATYGVGVSWRFSDHNDSYFVVPAEYDITSLANETFANEHEYMAAHAEDYEGECEWDNLCDECEEVVQQNCYSVDLADVVDGGTVTVDNEERHRTTFGVMQYVARLHARGLFNGPVWLYHS